MPPYPLYGETPIPGETGDSTAGLHTHSSKFPIEREVILSSADKNSKIPILHEYKKQRPKSIAPEGPNKQVAWTEDKKPAMPDYRYASTTSTGAIPRTWTADAMGRSPQTAVASESTLQDKNKAFPTRTYHTIKDMISSRFGNGKLVKDSDGFNSNEKVEQNTVPVLNNTAEANALNRRKENFDETFHTPGQGGMMFHNMGRRDNMGMRRDVSEGVSGTVVRREVSDGVSAIPSHSVLRRDISEGAGANAAHSMVRRDISEGASSHSAVRRDGSDAPHSMVRRDISDGASANMSHSVGRRDMSEAASANAANSMMRRDISDGISTSMSHSVGRRDMSDGAGANTAHSMMRRDISDGVSANMSYSVGRRDMSDGAGANTAHSMVRRDISEGASSHSAVRRDFSDGVVRRDGVDAPHPMVRRDMLDGVRRDVCEPRRETADSPAHSARYPRTLEQAGVYMMMRQNQPRPQTEGGNYGAVNTVALAKQEEDDDEGGFKTLRNCAPTQQQSSGQSSDYEKATQRSNADSGRGSTVYSSSHQAVTRLDTSTESSDSPQAPAGLANANDSEWVDIVESELRQILDPKMHGLPPAGANSTLSESISSMSPPLPPLSPGGGSSPSLSPQQSARYKHQARNMITSKSRAGWASKTQASSEKQHRQSSKKTDKIPLSPSVFGLDTTDLTSTTTGLDSVLENNSSEDDLSTTIDATDAHAIRKQLEGLEHMYSEVLKLLGVKKHGGRYQPSDPRINKRRLYGSMSSLPSSVSSRPIRDKRRQDERKKVKDMKGINKRFQRLESHVVTLARSVAHLSSEMRTQHLMIQEMENIRGEISMLRSQTLATRSQSMPRGLNAATDLPALANPTRVKKLTKFFGDEPPLLRLFLKKLGYEKYAATFEQERVGMVELPYLTEERLQKMGIPLGPRLRILQEAQISVCRDKVYVV